MVKRPAYLNRHLCWVVLALIVQTSSGRAQEGDADPQPLSRVPPRVPSPEHNPTTPQKVALGRQLFFDARLSGDSRMSCASCHQPEKALTDGLSRAKGHNGKPLERNTPTLLNVGFYAQYFWDGRAASLEEQALMPIESPDEMHQDLEKLEQELNAVPSYVEQFQLVFGTGVTRDGMAQALAAFQRTLLTRPSPFDRYLRGD